MDQEDNKMYFCTYFDINYLPRALALYHSIARTCNSFHIYMLCFDETSFDRISELHYANITPISLNEIESQDAELAAIKDSRTRLEYYYTCSPVLPLYILNNFLQVDLITYIDADLFFYSDPSVLIKEIDGYSISLTVHNFPEFRKSSVTGIYNVGWLSFRRDEQGLACLK
jgi:hypothetical protein